jgi:transcriptional regulator with XRE-family HTH domain
LTPAKAFGLTLRKLRARTHYSQEKLAMISGLDRTYISLLERGLRQPTISTIFQLARALDISSTELVAQVENLTFENTSD